MAERTAQNGPLHPFSDPGLTAEITRILGPHFMPRTFKPGALLWREGDTNGMLVSLAEGRVNLDNNKARTREHLHEIIPTMADDRDNPLIKR